MQEDRDRLQQRWDDLKSAVNVLGTIADPGQPTLGAPVTPVVTYSWFVYPAFRLSPGKVRYGAVAAHGSIAVRTGALRSETRTTSSAR